MRRGALTSEEYSALPAGLQRGTGGTGGFADASGPAGRRQLAAHSGRHGQPQVSCHHAEVSRLSADERDDFSFADREVALAERLDMSVRLAEPPGFQHNGAGSFLVSRHGSSVL